MLMAISNSIFGKLVRFVKRGNGGETSHEDRPEHKDHGRLATIPEAYPYGSRSLSAQVAAVQSLCPPQVLALEAHRRSLSLDVRRVASPLGRFTQRPHSAHISRNYLPQFERSDLQARHRRLSRKQSTAQLSTGLSHGDPNHALLELPDSSSLRTSAANGQSAAARDGQSLSPTDSPMCLQVPKKAMLSKRPLSMCSPVLAYEERHSSLSRKPDVSNLRTASVQAHIRSFSLPVEGYKSRSRNVCRSPITRADLDKPLPPVPLGKENTRWGARGAPRDTTRSASEMLPPMFQHFQLDSKSADYGSKSDVTYFRTWSPAVTHETITRQFHDIREEHTTRDVHEHDVYYRTLPVVDVRVLPARHFVPSESGLIEIAEEAVPTDFRPSEEWIRENATFSVLRNENELHIPDQLNEFDGSATDAGRSVTAQEVESIDSTHVHPTAVGPAILGTERVYAVRLDASDRSQDLE